jgi:hypothetical protein
MNMRVCEFLLRLYPKDHRELFGAEMAAVLGQAAEDRRALGRRAYLWFTICEIAGLLAGVTALWAARLAEHPPMEQPHVAMLWLPDSVSEVERLIQRNLDRMTNAIATHQFVQARFYSVADQKLREHLEKLRNRNGDADQSLLQ